LPFLRHRPDELTDSMAMLVTVPTRLAALGGLRGYRRALLEAGTAAAELANLAVDGERAWLWDTEFYDDVAAVLLGVDGVERVVTHVGYPVFLASDAPAHDGAPARDGGEEDLT